MEKTRFVDVSCDICGSNNRKHIGIPEISDIVKKNIKIPDGISIVKCADCGFYYTYPMPFWGSEDIKKLYDEKYLPDYSEWWKNIREKINPDRRLDNIQRLYGKEAQNFLEVGCGEGFVMDAAKKRGWKVHGQDISYDFADIVKKKLDVDIFVGELTDAGYPENYFDVIYLDSVIEHVPGPSKLVKEMYRITRPGGLVYIICPNEDSMAGIISQKISNIRGRKISKKLSPFFTPYHIVGFTGRSLKKIAEKNRFVIKYVLIGNDYRSFDSKKYIISDKKTGIVDKVLNALYFLGDMIGFGTNIEIALSPDKSTEITNEE